VTHDLHVLAGAPRGPFAATPAQAAMRTPACVAVGFDLQQVGGAFPARIG